MAIELKCNGPECSAVLGASFTIYEAAEAKALLLAALVKSEILEVDLSRVDRIDTAGVQLLILLKREAVAAGKQMRITQHSTGSIGAIDGYNLGPYFGDPVVLSSQARTTE